MHENSKSFGALRMRMVTNRADPGSRYRKQSVAFEISPRDTEFRIAERGMVLDVRPDRFRMVGA